MSPNTAKYRVKLPLTERWLTKHIMVGKQFVGVTYRNAKRAAVKAERLVRKAERRAHAKTLGYRGPRVLDSHWSDVSYRVFEAAAERAHAAADDSLRAVARAAGRLEEQRLLREFGVGQ